MNLYVITLIAGGNSTRVYRDRFVAMQTFDLLCGILKVGYGRVRLEYLDTSRGTAIGLEGDSAEIPMSLLRKYQSDGDMYWEEGMEAEQKGLVPFSPFNEFMPVTDPRDEEEFAECEENVWGDVGLSPAIYRSR